ncbi:hypothetical protein ACJ41O_012034 [Fusarium nematophilum]
MSSLEPAGKDPPTAVELTKEANIKFLGSFTASATVSVEIPLIQYDFHSTKTSPVLRPKPEEAGDLLGQTGESLENEYKYLEINPTQFRLLILSKGQRSDAIHCALKTVDSRELDQSDIVYQALSYSWGSEDDGGYHIFLRDIDIPLSEDRTERGGLFLLAAHQVIPRRFRVRSNLYQALKRLRSKTEDMWLWVDAICIDQANNEEKTHQLSKMIDIYSSAQNVCIWIGENEDAGGSDLPASTAMEFVPSIINLTMLERIISGQRADEQTARSCSAFARLLKRPWFGRRWVIQEVSAARRASIQCGSHRMNWIDFADAVELFTANIEGIRSMYSKMDTAMDYPDALRHVESGGAKAIVSNTNNVLRKAQNGTVVDRPMDIESLVLTFSHFNTSDPRDTIYAFLGLASDGHFSSPPPEVPSLHPNYTRTPVQAYMEFVRHCVVARGTLDIICRNWALPLGDSPTRPSRGGFNSDTYLSHDQSLGAKSIPSWIGLVSNSAFGPPSKFTGRLNGDSLVGEPGRPIYNASRGSHMVVQFGERETKSSWRVVVPELDGTLRVAGMAIGTVSRATSRVVDGTISDDCLEMMGWYQDDDINTIPDTLWRTLVADRDRNGQPPPLWYRRACMYCLKKTTAEGDLNTARLLETRSLPETVLQFLRRVQAVVWSRKFLVCRDLREPSSQLLGLGSRHARRGDIACILYGCSVPVLLRPLGVSDQYKLVGECYLQGKMDGEALTGLGQESIKQATTFFNII